MLIKDSLWRCILLILSSIHLIIAIQNQRENLALRHPCYSLNRRLQPYVKWTEKLASTQHKVQKDACGQLRSGPACCTNEIFNSYAVSLGTDLKNLFDGELGQLAETLSMFNKKIDIWTNEYFTETRRVTASSLETLFGTKEYHPNIHHTLTTLFNVLGNPQSTIDDISKSSVHLFEQLILSTYRQFMTYDHNMILNENLQKCLINRAFAIEALPTQRELLYTLTSAASLVHILRTLFIYIDADIQRLKSTGTLHSHHCLQRYVRETLCPICIDISSSAFSSSVHYDNNINEPLCENDCHYVIKTCFDQTNNPYVAFALMAQGYSSVIKRIQESVVELKLVERLSKLHIYLYDMVINATNTQLTYKKLQSACPNSNEKPFSPILSLSPIISERRELVTKWNDSLHWMLDQLRTSVENLNTTLTQQIVTEICSNSNYAVKTNRCTQIDQQMPGNSSQWPLPLHESSSPITININIELMRNQLDDLNKKMSPIKDVIISLQPKKKYHLMEYLPEFDYDEHLEENDAPIPMLNIESSENEQSERLSERIYNEIDGLTTTQSINQSPLLTYNIRSYLIVSIILIIHRISFMNK